MDISYIFCLMGTFWGVSLTLEHPPGEWWYHPDRFYFSIMFNDKSADKNQIDSCTVFALLSKGLLTGIIYYSLLYCFNKIPYINFMFNFVINCFKYFITFYICTGVLPIIYGGLGLNKERKSIKKNIDEFVGEKSGGKKNINKLFESSLFVKCFDRTRIPILSGDKSISYITMAKKEIFNPNEDSFVSLQ